MLTKRKGDKELVDHIGKLKEEIENYIKLFHSLAECFDESLIRFNAILYPTAESKIKAVSLPPMDIISKEIRDLIKKVKNESDSIVFLLEEIENIIKTSRTKCNHCDGVGKVYIKSYYREDDFIQPYVEIVKCPECEGEGYFKVSETVIQLANELLTGIQELKTLLISHLQQKQT